MTAYELLARIANGTAPKRIRIIDIDRDFMLGEDVIITVVRKI